MNKIFLSQEGNSTIVMAFVPVGSYYEPEQYKGISHFIEHLCFKGTKNRSGKQISSAIDNVGGDINAFTDNEITAYHATVGNKYKNIAKDVIVDLISNPVFPKKEIIKERQVILQEKKMYEDNLNSAVWDLFNSTVHGKNSGHCIGTIGTEESLYNINKKTIEEFYHKHYDKKITLVIIGDTEYKLSILSSLSCPVIKDDLINLDGSLEILHTRPKITQANVVLGGVPSFHSKGSKIYNQSYLELLNAIYSDMSGRLFSKIREKHNLVYRIRFNAEVFNNGDIAWGVSLGLDTNKIKEAKKMILDELQRPLTSLEKKILLQKVIGTKQMELDSKNKLAHIVAYDSVRAMPFSSDLDIESIEHRYIEQIDTLNTFIKDMCFNKNALVGIIPER